MTSEYLCDRIVNNGMGEPTECGRTLPCEYHDPLPAERDEPVRTWFRDDCSCPVTDRNGDLCALSTDTTRRLCDHCEAHEAAIPSVEALAILESLDRLSKAILTGRYPTAGIEAANARTLLHEYFVAHNARLSPPTDSGAER